MKPTLRSFLLAPIAFIAGCNDAPLVEPSLRAPESEASELGAARGAAHAVTVLNWNLYIGTDVDAVIAALATPDPSDDLPALLGAIATLVETDYPSRAAAIADAIAKASPEVIGLQEVSVIDIDLTALGGPRIDLDFMAILQAALAARGLDYDVAAIVTNTVAAPFPGISVIDKDAILVDPGRVTVTSSVAQNFTNNLGPIGPVTLIRGFAGITGTIGGRSYAIFSTHLEPDLGALDLSGLRALQAGELLAAVGGAERAILMGDFNDVAGSLMHQVVTGGGFTDVWGALRPGVAGLTCCHAADLSNKRPTFAERIDYVFSRGAGHPITGVRGRVDRLGDVPADRVSGPEHPLWPSDHAGLVADLRVPPAHGLVASAGS